MTVVLPDGLSIGEHRLSPEDDNFHAPLTADRFEHETAWFWFFIPERRIGAWLYHFVRPNIPLSGGGLYLFDETAWFHMEAPYYLNYSAAPMPKDPDLRDCRFPTGFHLKTLDPLSRYHLSYRDRDIVSLELDWRAVMPPWVTIRGEPPLPRHFDQFGRVTGKLTLHGESLQVDCLAIRDRSWRHVRPEPWKDGWGGGSYVTGAASPELAFLAGSPGGFLVQDGVRSRLIASQVERTRDPDHGFIRRIVVSGRDELGRSLEAEGEALSRMAFPIGGAHGVCWTSLVRYSINGVPAWGDDQDAWPLAAWAAMRRGEQKHLKDVRRPTLRPASA
jgi:hypothetical protein